ncbi:MAG: hypothetical protein CL699_03855 [Chloroflexi bacterium]|nr:MAG: hypothetical protein EGP10_00690 [SAR202 cluster bacterium]MAO75429.1 hypothetical protein [Chloroflexota bacterium]
MTNNHFYDDLNDVKANILEADVISIFFPNFQKSVLVDTRSNDTDGPSIMLTPMARSPRERVKSMEKLRPGFPEVKNMILIPWLRYIFSLEESGIWELLIERLDQSTHLNSNIAANTILDELKNLEYLELLDVIKGDQYQTIWPKESD